MRNAKQKAIFELYNSVVTIYMVDDEFTAKDENGNEVSIDMTAVNTKATELENAEVDLKASAKAKLIAGEPLTEEEADTIVL
jgi:hypothetical protein